MAKIMTSGRKKQLQGIIVPLVTPLSRPDRVDRDGLRRLIQYVLKNGAHGLFLLSAIGESPSLIPEMKKIVVETAMDVVDGHVPVAVGVSDPCPALMKKNIELAALLGADAVVLTAPQAFPLGLDELADFFEKTAGSSPLPLWLYDVPTLPKSRLAPELVQRLSAHTRIAGLMDSHSDVMSLQELLQRFRGRRDFRIFTGVDTLLAEAALFHGAGGIPGGANVDPALFASIHSAAKRRDFKTVDRLQRRVTQLSAIHRHDRYWSSYIKGIKAALSLMGVCSDVMSDTFPPLPEAEKTAIRNELKNLGLL
jgi:dihydrodipicolinate synthase/N-acetylneuraminate lyase